MGKPRIRGNQAKILVRNSSGQDVQVGEISKFSVKELGEIKKSRSIGQKSITANKTFEGYDLSFEGGKVDWNLAQILHKQDEKIYDGGRSPYFTVLQEIVYYDNSRETFSFDDVTIYGYSLDIDANDELMEKFEGFCGTLKVVQTVGNNIANSMEKNQTFVDDMIKKALGKDSTII
jgi:hypothetical protein